MKARITRSSAGLNLTEASELVLQTGEALKNPWPQFEFFDWRHNRF